MVSPSRTRHDAESTRHHGPCPSTSPRLQDASVRYLSDRRKPALRERHVPQLFRSLFRSLRPLPFQYHRLPTRPISGLPLHLVSVLQTDLLSYTDASGDISPARGAPNHRLVVDALLAIGSDAHGRGETALLRHEDLEP